MFTVCKVFLLRCVVKVQALCSSVLTVRLVIYETLKYFFLKRSLQHDHVYQIKTQMKGQSVKVAFTKNLNLFSIFTHSIAVDL